MKSYAPEKLVAISRYKEFFPTLAEDIQRDVYQRMRILLPEEQQYCDKGNYKHIAQILTSIALYRSLQAYGKTEGAAENVQKRYGESTEIHEPDLPRNTDIQTIEYRPHR